MKQRRSAESEKRRRSKTEDQGRKGKKLRKSAG